MAESHKIEIVDNNELTLKDIRETFYHCRDFEITNLWQRSIFLYGFILACFTGYGAILISLLTTGDQKIAYPYFANFIECVISLIGIVFSIIWIMMAKGSKAWYEIYEKAIGIIEHSDKANNEFVNIPNDYRMGNYCTQYKHHINDCLFSTKGGKYSPSKLNVFIGQVVLVIWCVCFVAHFAVLFYNTDKCEWIHKQMKCCFDHRSCWYVILCIGLVIAIAIIFWIRWKGLKSSHIKEMESHS